MLAASELAVTQGNNQIDPRLVRVTIMINGVSKVYENVFISAVGVKYANPLQDEAEVTIYNLDRTTQDYILTETSPYNTDRSPKTVIVEAGRQSYGTTVIYTGNIIYSSVTQPPDVGVVLYCLTSNVLKANIISRFQPGIVTVSEIAAAVAQDAGVFLSFQGTDKNVSNYSYAGSTLQQLEVLAAMGAYNVFIDGDTLYVKNQGDPLNGTLRNLSASTGMIGIPQFTERGVRVKFFVDNKTVIGGGVNLVSEIYPSVNGVYVIYQLAFQITNRLTPFYYIADCFRIGEVSEEATSG